MQILLRASSPVLFYTAIWIHFLQAMQKKKKEFTKYAVKVQKLAKVGDAVKMFNKSKEVRPVKIYH